MRRVRGGKYSFWCKGNIGVDLVAIKLCMGHMKAVVMQKRKPAFEDEERSRILAGKNMMIGMKSRVINCNGIQT